MRKAIFISVTILTIVLLFGFGLSTNMNQTANSEENPWVTEIDQLIKQDARIQGALVGISVRSAKTGELLYDHMGNTRLRTASNMKLLTAAAALNVLGEDYVFRTEVFTDGRIKGNQLIGNLFLKGKGDPTLQSSDFEQIAEDLESMGVTKIKGNIIGDDTWFDDIRYSPDLVWSDEHTYYGAQVSALTASPNQEYDAGTVIVNVQPGDHEGEKAKIKVKPETNYINIVNQAKTVAENKESKLFIERNHGSNQVIVKGTIPIQSLQREEWISVWEPTGYALDLFTRALQKQGISWNGSILYQKAPEKIKRLVVHESMPLSDLLVPFMKLSNNGHAEVLVKEMGKANKGEGSWEKGLEVMREQLTNYGLDTDSMVLRDGSGISHVNLVPANQISDLLYKVRQEKWFRTYVNALPIAGKEERMTGGTLRYRLKDIKAEVIAKTGTISTVSSLSGYMKSGNGKELIFSILINNVTNEEVGRSIEDKIIHILNDQ
ncbi:D-alanyl-D-alanine carboxypeptidase/D-alanyl-D-alanine-endopeptidase [Aquibacillus koreensis]|uniref:D-alanyl-D-alanine carboxypeptidase/D-alanyl-D-alanine-endopeptidase n=1 Tax=Aquibacillus koreensis TaxID=279446 RepID=A0A9X3WNQ4_9BACI|nr:D-alanyl-D-alanine carboxypeptidase/D-alanyl-D-alanine-endopeptidase [Aquibacillus koreensis]MCT2534219.1 D-alanyl-D-alanine carboxypeptidase/D-alanyl-D-alanine-endopeptidase [Aquibacillus koreensis]MDC3420736.1 D-alanyl-D-alanine carboxypeptidase/D-alanyl-D-alanine-endopeptidase [Aquibacillus koreensis]